MSEYIDSRPPPLQILPGKSVSERTFCVNCVIWTDALADWAILFLPRPDFAERGLGVRGFVLAIRLHHNLYTNSGHGNRP